jgi:excisionase family DNA binding protein
MQEIRTVSACPLLTVREVATKLRVCTATVYKLCASGRLPYDRLSTHVIRVAEDDLADFRARQRRLARGGPRRG